MNPAKELKKIADELNPKSSSDMAEKEILLHLSLMEPGKGQARAPGQVSIDYSSPDQVGGVTISEKKLSEVYKLVEKLIDTLESM